MKTNIILQGGLGNQTFQYAYGHTLRKLGYEVNFDTSFFMDIKKYTKRDLSILKFNLSLDKNFSDKKTKNIFHIFRNKFINLIKSDIKVRFRKINTNRSIFDYLFLKTKDDYYQSEKYFSQYREEILQEFTLKKEFQSEKYLSFKKQIQNSKKNLIIHARRGDYLNNSENSVFNIIDEEYYKKSIEEITRKTNATIEEFDVFIFSDDVNWLKKTLNLNNIIAVSGNSLSDYEELSLMSFGQNFIIPNSTFSWWGAWLSSYENKLVIAPKFWFKEGVFVNANTDIIPETWTRV
jgi:hypothetical protein